MAADSDHVLASSSCTVFFEDFKAQRRADKNRTRRKRTNKSPSRYPVLDTVPDDSSREENSSVHLTSSSTSVERATRRSKDHTKEKASRYKSETGLPLA